jgi:hypothetical protein
MEEKLKFGSAVLLSLEYSRTGRDALLGTALHGFSSWVLTRFYDSGARSDF